MKYILLSALIISYSLMAEQTRKEYVEKYPVTENDVLIIEGEIDVIVENWNKNEISIQAILDYSQKSVIEIESSGEHAIDINKSGIFTRKMY